MKLTKESVLANLKKVEFEETFKSPFEKETIVEAVAVLEEIRKIHNEANGWREISSYIEKLPNGKFRAVRHHVKLAV